MLEFKKMNILFHSCVIKCLSLPFSLYKLEKQSDNPIEFPFSEKKGMYFYDLGNNNTNVGMNDTEILIKLLETKQLELENYNSKFIIYPLEKVEQVKGDTVICMGKFTKFQFDSGNVLFHYSNGDVSSNGKNYCAVVKFVPGKTPIIKKNYVKDGSDISLTVKSPLFFKEEANNKYAIYIDKNRFVPEKSIFSLIKPNLNADSKNVTDQDSNNSNNTEMDKRENLLEDIHDVSESEDSEQQNTQEGKQIIFRNNNGEIEIIFSKAEKYKKDNLVETKKEEKEEKEKVKEVKTPDLEEGKDNKESVPDKITQQDYLNVQNEDELHGKNTGKTKDSIENKEQDDTKGSNEDDEKKKEISSENNRHL